MPFDKIQPKDIVVGDKAVMYAPWTPLPPKKVIIFGVDNKTIKVITDDDSMFEFSRNNMEHKTETGYVWELKKYDEKKFNEYTYKLEELVEIRKLKKKLGKIMDQITVSWQNVQDIKKIRRIVVLLEIAQEELGIIT